jgi:hypothetical protein
MTRRVVFGVFVVSIALGILAVPGAAATKDPCAVVKRREIASVFGGTVSKPERGDSTVRSGVCNYAVGGNGVRPQGTVSIHVMFKNGKVAFDGLPSVAPDYRPMTELPRALFSEKTGTIDMLVKGKLLGVQGVFFGPGLATDVKPQLVELAALARRRV